jgi:hypothetical protein
MKRIKIIIILFSSLSLCRAQVNFTSIPRDLELIPRDSADYAHFAIAGTCPSTVMIVKITIAGGDSIFVNRSVKIANGAFNIPVKLKAQLVEYTLNLSFYNALGTETAQKTVASIVAGDLFIIGGQSNAVAPPDNDSAGAILDAKFAHSCCRSIGTHPAVVIPEKISIDDDSRFSRPTCRGWADLKKGYLGVWGLKLQYDLAVRTGIPNCFLNSSIGGTPISYHFATNTPSDPDSLLFEVNSIPTGFRLYDRVFKKLNNNGLCDNVRGIFWYQGETDANMSIDGTSGYTQRFDTLYQSWKMDFPSLERIYMMQLNTGCGGDNMSLMRQIQNDIASSHSDITIMSTVGTSPSDKTDDGCHYSEAGYLGIADKLVPVVCYEIYDEQMATAHIYPPKVREIYYTDEATICIEFDRNISAEDSMYYDIGHTGWAYLKDYFYNEYGSEVNPAQVTLEENKFFLHFTEKSLVKKLTYLPQTWNNLPAVYNGPWIVNAGNRKLGALSFFQLPVHYNISSLGVQVYPNPANQLLNIKYLPWKKIISISLFDIHGKRLLDADVNEEAVELSLDQLLSGIYFLKITHSERTEMKKIIVNH